MLNSIARVVENFKQSWSREIEDQAILDACAEAQHRWRERDLGPITTVRMFLLQILWGNTACNHVARLAGVDVTGSAYCEARARLPLVVFQTLLKRCTAKMVESVRDTGCWLGHRFHAGRIRLFDVRHGRTSGTLRSARPANAGLRLSGRALAGR